jgi:hypothetical protein
VVRWDTTDQDPLLKVCGSSVMVEFATGIKVRATKCKVAGWYS